MLHVTAHCIPVLIQQNIDGSNFFNRSWAEFKVGFNDSRGNYWLGNDLLSQLTLSGHYKLRFDLQLLNHSWCWAEYSRFTVHGESSNYTLHVSGYSGNIGFDALGRYHHGMKFTTYDRDNDPWTSNSTESRQYNDNCAKAIGGGFWYGNCGRCRVNGVRGRDFGFSWIFEKIYLHLQRSRMWLTC